MQEDARASTDVRLESARRKLAAFKQGDSCHHHRRNRDYLDFGVLKDEILRMLGSDIELVVRGVEREPEPRNRAQPVTESSTDSEVGDCTVFALLVRDASHIHVNGRVDLHYGAAVEIGEPLR